MTIEGRLEEIEALLHQKQNLSALALANNLLIEYPASAQAKYILAQTMLENGNYAGALHAAEQACALDSQNFQYIFLCGKLYSHFSLYEFALPLLLKSVGLEPRACVSQYELGDCYLELKLAEKALPCYQTALKLSPPEDLKHQIRLHLAECLINTNRPAEAIPLLKRLVSDGSEHSARAYLMLVSLEKTKPGTPVAEKVSKAMAAPNLSNQHKRILHLAQGKILLNASLHKEAFQEWQQSAVYGRPENWLPRDYQREFSELTKFYNANLFEKCALFGHESHAPTFIAGMPRSGTTLTEQIVASHSMATGVGELGRWIRLDQALRNDYRELDHVLHMTENASKGELRTRAEETLEVFRNIAGKLKQRVVEKMPHNFIFAGYQALLFPNAKFIHLRRHPADTFVSTIQNNFSAYHSYVSDQAEYAKEYAFHEKLMTYWKSIFGDRILTVQYEKLATDPQSEARRIIDFIGLPWEDQCLEFYKRNSTVRTFSTQQVRQPVYTSSVERWRDYEAFLGPLFKALDDMGLKYPPEDQGILATVFNQNGP